MDSGTARYDDGWSGYAFLKCPEGCCDRGVVEDTKEEAEQAAIARWNTRHTTTTPPDARGQERETDAR